MAQSDWVNYTAGVKIQGSNGARWDPRTLLGSPSSAWGNPRVAQLYPSSGSPHMLCHACSYKLANNGQDTEGLRGLPWAPGQSTHRSVHRVADRSVRQRLAALIGWW
jgi:hypothetical protein